MIRGSALRECLLDRKVGGLLVLGRRPKKVFMD